MTDPMVMAAAAVLVISAIATAAVAIIKQLQVIHFLVNSTATESAKKLERLEATIAALQSQRVADAQSTAQASPAIAPAANVAEQVVGHQVVERQSVKKS